MKLLFFGLAVTVLPLFAAHQDVALPPIALYTQFQAEPPAAILASMQSEVRTIMAPAGFTFNWIQLSTADGTHSVVELAIVSFKGRCDADELRIRDSIPGALGWTNVSDGVILPFANVDCSAVRSYIQKELLALPPDARIAAFGRALGRVLAHELYHIFANTMHHGADGVAAEFFNVDMLLRPDFQFGARESAALVNSQAHAYLENAAAAIADELEHRF